MLHFQISPPKPTPKSVAVGKDESSIPVYLVLGAFAAIPKIHFETVKMGQSRKRTLIVRNPSNQVAWLKIVKKPSAAFQLSWDAENVDPQIEPNGQCVVDITWRPTEEGQCFQTFQFQSSLTGIKFSVHLLGVCSSPPPKRNYRSRPLVSSQNIQASSSQVKSPEPAPRIGINVLPASGTRDKSTRNLSETVSNLTRKPPSGFSTKTSDCTSVKRNSTTPPTTPHSAHRDELSACDIIDAFAFPFTPDARSKKSDSNIADTAIGLRRETFLIESSRNNNFQLGMSSFPITSSESNGFDGMNTVHDSNRASNYEDEELGSLASELDAFLSRIDAAVAKNSA